MSLVDPASRDAVTGTAADPVAVPGVDDLSTPRFAPREPARSDARVLAVLVAHDGEPWLDRTLTALADQTHRHLEVVAVDNGSTDGSRDRLLAHLSPDQVLVADIDLGYAAAVSMALDARAAHEVDHVLLLHDDLALHPDAVGELAAALDDDPRLAVVGPKLLEWDDERRLQAVGWTVDLTGRAVPSVEEDELDQGQRDGDRRTLYVSSGGMMVRRGVFDELGRFDRRYHLFRDDLDLCWRAWLAGHDVEVVPHATAQHAAAAHNDVRLGRTGLLGPRYFDERNVFATLLKNYGTARLLLVVPLYLAIGVAKIFGFLLTRRFADVWQTIRAWLWNGLHVFETRRLRREVQAHRVRSDAELRDLFGRISPRIRAYAEAIGAWVAGADTAVEAPAPPDEAVDPATATAKVVHAFRTRPVLIVGGVLTVLVLTGAIAILGPGQLRGGQLAPWPASPSAFLTDHAAAWHTVAGLGSSAAPSPAQALLGVLQAALFGSAYLASRVLLLGPLLVAWLFALRATQRYSPRKLPRVAAATAYVLSPPALAALVTGQVGALIVLAAVPGLVAAGGTLARRVTGPARAWRAAAGAALLGAVAGAFVPVVLVVLAAAGLILLVALLPTAPVGWRLPLTARIGLAAGGPWVLLLPWSWRLFADDGPLLAGGANEVATAELWRWLALAPDVAGFPGLLAGGGFVVAGVLGVLFGWRRQARLVAVLWVLALSGAVVGWWLAGRVASVWSGLPLVLSAAAFAGLLAVAFAAGESALRRQAFGWRQLAAAGTGVAVAVSLVTVALGLVAGTGATYVRDVPALPPFITATATDQDPFRVLVLVDVEGEVLHEVVPGSGPSMAATGVDADPAASAAIDRAVAHLLSGRDVRAGTALGQLGVRFVVVPDGGVTPRLDEALRGQVDLEPRPVAAGRVLAVTTALPRASLVTSEQAATLATSGGLPVGTEPVPLPVRAGDRLQVETPRDGVLLVTEPAGSGWEARADGVPLARVDGPIVAFEVPTAGARLELVPTGQTARTVALVLQGLVLFLVVSLMLRPPGFARSGLAAAEAAARRESHGAREDHRG